MASQADDPTKPEETGEAARPVRTLRFRIPESVARIATRAGGILIGLVIVFAIGVTIVSHRSALTGDGVLRRGVAGEAGPEDVAALKRDTQALTNRLDAADTRITTLEKQTQTAQPSSATALGDLNTRLGAVDSQLSALQSQMARAADKDSEAALANRIAKLEADNSGSALHRAAAILALATLARAAEEGMPFKAQFDALEAARPGDPAIPALRPLAPQGVPTFATLAARFPDAARHALDAERRDAARGVLARLWASFRSLVSIRRVGDTEGDSSEDRLARAQADLDRNDLAAAAMEAHALTGASANTIAPWRDAADQRLALEQTLAGLNARMVQDLAGTAGAPPRSQPPADAPRQIPERARDSANSSAPAPAASESPSPAPGPASAQNAPAPRALPREAAPPESAAPDPANTAPDP